MKRIVLFILLLCLTACDDTCTKENAARFFIAYRNSRHNEGIDYNLSYIIKRYIISVEKTNLIDVRYDTPVCRVKIKNELAYGYGNGSAPFSLACFTYVPRTGRFVQETGIKDCCNPDYVDANNKFCYF